MDLASCLRRLAFPSLALAGVVLLLLTGGASVATAQSSVEPWTDELGLDSRPGPLHYVALGDSFSSGEGAPYVDPNQINTWVAQRKYQQCVLFAPAGGEACVNDRPGDKEIENGVGWLGDTGTDVDVLEGVEGRFARIADGYSFGGNNCHRSSHAYAARTWGGLDAEDPNWGLTFAACSGALATNYRQDFRSEPGQSDAFLAGPADLVTLGFGGNDVGFGAVVSCVLGEAATDRGLTVGQVLDPANGTAADAATQVDGCATWYGRNLDTKLAQLNEQLGVIYDDVRLTPGNLKPGGRVFAVGYPRLFPAVPPASCSLGSGGSVGRDTMVWLNGFADALNATIENTAAEHGVEFVDTSEVLVTPGEDKVRHDFCVDEDGDRWVNRLIPSDLRRSMHPTFQYHERVADQVLGCWRRTADCPAAAG